jgi:hypothetical protein
MADKPFILVLVSFFKDQGGASSRSWRRCPHRHGDASDVSIAEGQGRGLPCVAAHACPTIGYICALTDPDGNISSSPSIRVVIEAGGLGLS